MHVNAIKRDKMLSNAISLSSYYKLKLSMPKCDILLMQPYLYISLWLKTSDKAVILPSIFLSRSDFSLLAVFLSIELLYSSSALSSSYNNCISAKVYSVIPTLFTFSSFYLCTIPILNKIYYFFGNSCSHFRSFWF